MFVQKRSRTWSFGALVAQHTVGQPGQLLLPLGLRFDYWKLHVF